MSRNAPSTPDEAAVGIALGMRAILDVHQMAILGDDPRFALNFVAGAGAAKRALQVGAIVGMNQRQPGAALQIRRGCSRAATAGRSSPNQ